MEKNYTFNSIQTDLLVTWYERLLATTSTGPITAENFEDFLACYGKYARPVIDEGACFFESVAECRSFHENKFHNLSSPDDIQRLREQCVECVRQMPEEDREWFGVTEENIVRILNPTEWSGDLEINNTAKALNVQIIIYHKHGGLLRVCTKTPAIPNRPVSEIWYHNNDVKLSETDYNHYSPLFVIEEETHVLENKWFTNITLNP